MCDLTLLLLSNNNYVKFKDFENLQDVSAFKHQLEKSRIQEMESTSKIVTEICKSLESLKSDVLKSTKELNIGLIRTKMITWEEKMYNVKETIKEELINFLDCEEKIMKEIRILAKRLEDWENPSNLQIIKPSKSSIHRTSNYDGNNPTAEFQKFLSSCGGHYGGWLEQDHFLFIKERKKHKNTESFFSSMHSLLPDLSYDEIVEHENWFLKYESLKSAQKEAIQKWKAEKLIKEEQKVEIEGEVEKKEMKSNKRLAHQRDITERIKIWKKQQAANRVAEIERQNKEKKQLREEKEKLKEIQKLKKLAVDKYRAEKLNKAQAFVSTTGENKTFQLTEKAKNNILLKSFRDQDKKLIERKKIIRLELESKAKSRVEKLKLKKCPFDFFLQRDPQRIFKPTIIWSQHCQTEKTEKIKYAFDLNSIPHLAIPEWRRELK